MVCDSPLCCASYDIIRDDKKIRFNLASSPNGIVIDKPGVYKVIKDIDWEATKPTQLSSTTSSGITGTAITITASDVTLDFCGHTIKQINGYVATFVGGIGGTTGSTGTILTVSSVTNGGLVPGLWLTGSSGPIGNATRLTTYLPLNSTGTVGPSQNVTPGTTLYAWAYIKCINIPQLAGPINNVKIIGPGTIRDFSASAIQVSNPTPTVFSSYGNVFVADGLTVLRCNRRNVGPSSATAIDGAIIEFNRSVDNVYIQNCTVSECLNMSCVSIVSAKDILLENNICNKGYATTNMVKIVTNSGDVALGRTTKNLVIRNCIVEDTTMLSYTFLPCSGITFTNIENLLFENNIICNLIKLDSAGTLVGVHNSGNEQLKRGNNAVYRNCTVSNLVSTYGERVAGFEPVESQNNILFDNCKVSDLTLLPSLTLSGLTNFRVYGFYMDYSQDNSGLSPNTPVFSDNINLVFRNCVVSNLNNLMTTPNTILLSVGFGYEFNGFAYTVPNKGLQNVTLENCIVNNASSLYGSAHGILFDGHALVKANTTLANATDPILQNLIVRDCILSGIKGNGANSDVANTAGLFIAGVAKDVMICGTILDDNENGLIISNKPSFLSNTLPYNVTVQGCKAAYNLRAGFVNQVANTFYSNTYSFSENHAYFNGNTSSTNYVGMPVGTPIRNWQVGLAPVATGAGSSDNLNRFA